MGRLVLALDMCRTHLRDDYGAASAKYVDAFRQNVNSEEVNHRCEAFSRG
jgi:hypothetical protein